MLLILSEVKALVCDVGPGGLSVIPASKLHCLFKPFLVHCLLDLLSLKKKEENIFYYLNSVLCRTLYFLSFQQQEHSFNLYQLNEISADMPSLIFEVSILSATIAACWPEHLAGVKGEQCKSKHVIICSSSKIDTM